MANSTNYFITFIVVFDEFLQNGVIRKIEHRAVASGQINAVEHLTGNFIQAFRVPQHIPEFRIVPAAFGQFVHVHRFQTHGIDGGVASLRTCDDDVISPLFRSVVNVGELAEPQSRFLFSVGKHPGSGYDHQYLHLFHISVFPVLSIKTGHHL